MSVKYVTVSIYELDTKYLAKVVDTYKASIRNRTLVYSIKHNTYFTSSTPPHTWYENVICHTQDEFMQTVEQHKLLKLLGH